MKAWCVCWLSCWSDAAQVGTIVWHVAAHEIGHAIYGLDGMKDAIKVSTKTLLEEPRAELTALHTMTLLLPAGLLKQVRTLPIHAGCSSVPHRGTTFMPHKPGMGNFPFVGAASWNPRASV